MPQRVAPRTNTTIQSGAVASSVQAIFLANAARESRLPGCSRGIESWPGGDVARLDVVAVDGYARSADRARLCPSKEHFAAPRTVGTWCSR